MRAPLLAFALAALIASPCLRAAAQDAPQSEDAPNEVQPGELVIDPGLADARYLRDVGMGLTLAGLATTGLGTGLMFGLQDWGGVIGGGTFEGLGGVFGLVGIPMWIVGAVRSEILGARDVDRERVAWDYELAGIATTLVGLAMSVAGTAMLLAGYGASSGTFLADSATETMRSAGGVMIPIGVFVALFIGTPLWAEGARF